MKKNIILFTFAALLTVFFIFLFGSNDKKILKREASIKQNSYSSSNSVEKNSFNKSSEEVKENDLEEKYSNTAIILLNKDQEIVKFEQIINNSQVNNLFQQEISSIIKNISSQLIGATYSSDLLDQTDNEHLVISLTEFDCFLFIENVLALAKSIAEQNYSFNNFISKIENQRYRDGNMKNYCSRLHYFSDWLYDNERRNNVVNIGKQLGGKTLVKDINYMTNHRAHYQKLINNNLNYECLKKVEFELKSFEISYIPTNMIKSIYKEMQSGDIIGVATEIEGLDVTHTGLVYKQSEYEVGFIHASPAGTVSVAHDLQEYIANVPKSIGIIIARPTDPRVAKTEI